MKKFSIIISLLLVTFMLSGCKSSKQLLNDKIKADDVDTVQIVLAMGNPEYGANSKIITDKTEINKIVDIFNSAYIGDEVNDGDVHVTAGSSYYFYGGDNTLNQFIFNGNDTERIWLNSKYYYVIYTDSTPYDMYRESSANEIVVDEDMAEMERLQEVIKGNPSPEEILADNPSADFFVWEGIVCINASDIDWIKELDLSGGTSLGVIKRTGIKANWQDWDATALEAGAEILELPKSGGVMIARKDGKSIAYLKMLEG